jgi:hypothetical protein
VLVCVLPPLLSASPVTNTRLLQDEVTIRHKSMSQVPCQHRVPKHKSFCENEPSYILSGLNVGAGQHTNARKTCGASKPATPCLRMPSKTPCKALLTNVRITNSPAHALHRLP